MVGDGAVSHKDAVRLLNNCCVKISTILNRQSMPQHPLEVLDFAVRHGHVDLANESARASMGQGMADAKKALARDTFDIWVSGGNLKLIHIIESLLCTDSVLREVA